MLVQKWLTDNLKCLYRVLPESPRWLLSKGREDQAMAIFTKIAKSNKTQMPSVNDVRNLLEEKKQLGFWHVIHSRELVRRLIIVFSNV